MLSIQTLKTIYSNLGIHLKVIFVLSSVSFIVCYEKKICWDFNHVPYKIEPGFSTYQENYIKQEIAIINSETCIYWSDMDDSPGLKNLTSFVAFEKAEPNASSCDTITQYPYFHHPLKVVILLSDFCFYGRTVLHEIVHALGFKHEHQRLDRDCYVWISDSAKAKNSNYKIKQYIPNLDRFPYDKQSIMHYPRSNDMRALSERFYPHEPLGNPEERLTYMDVWKIQYRFCGRPHYCEVYHQHCRDMERFESEMNCIKTNDDSIAR